MTDLNFFLNFYTSFKTKQNTISLKQHAEIHTAIGFMKHFT